MATAPPLACASPRRPPVRTSLPGLHRRIVALRPSSAASMNSRANGSSAREHERRRDPDPRSAPSSRVPRSGWPSPWSASAPDAATRKPAAGAAVRSRHRAAHLMVLERRHAPADSVAPRSCPSLRRSPTAKTSVAPPGDPHRRGFIRRRLALIGRPFRTERRSAADDLASSEACRKARRHRRKTADIPDPAHGEEHGMRAVPADLASTAGHSGFRSESWGRLEAVSIPTWRGLEGSVANLVRQT
jgi:hypothetical protein